VAKGSDRGVDAVVEIHNRIIRPQLRLDFFAANNLALTLQEHPQDLKNLFSQENLIRVWRLSRSQFARAEVELKGSESNAS
jgi:hypothetical protein